VRRDSLCSAAGTAEHKLRLLSAQLQFLQRRCSKFHPFAPICRICSEFFRDVLCPATLCPDRAPSRFTDHASRIGTDHFPENFGTKMKKSENAKPQPQALASPKMGRSSQRLIAEHREGKRPREPLCNCHPHARSRAPTRGTPRGFDASPDRSIDEHDSTSLTKADPAQSNPIRPPNL
jgi:hypothetical protein